MIRRRDYLRLTTQKLALRKKRAIFAIISVALGVIVVVTANSLLKGVRDVAVKTIWTEEIDPDLIRVYAGDNPYELLPPEEGPKPKAKKRIEYLSEAVFDEIRGWSGVEAADRPIVVQPVSVNVFDKRPRGANELQGVPEPMLLRYVTDRALVTANTNAIPLVVGERNVLLRFDEKHGKLEPDPAGKQGWLGREVTILLGDNYARISRFQYDYNKREFKPLSEDEVTSQHDAMERSFRVQFDTAIFNTTLVLKGRIAGFCPGSKVFIPLDTAAMCEKWIDQRNRLASRNPPRETSEVVYGERGRRTPKPGEYTEGVVLVKKGADVRSHCQTHRGNGIFRCDPGAHVRGTGAGVRQQHAHCEEGGVRVRRPDSRVGVRAGLEHHLEDGFRQPRRHRAFPRAGRHETRDSPPVSRRSDAAGRARNGGGNGAGLGAGAGDQPLGDRLCAPLRL